MQQVPFETLLIESKASQERILTASQRQNEEKAKKIDDRKENKKETFEQYYKLVDGAAVFKEQISYEVLEKLHTCDDAKFMNCINVFKTNDCLVHWFEEDVTQKEYNCEHWFGSEDINTNLFKFVCRCNQWFFTCELDIHNDCEGGILMCREFFNCETKETIDHYCDLFGKNTSPCDSKIMFEIMKSGLSRQEYMNNKWQFLSVLSDRLNGDGFINEYKRDFDLYPGEHFRRSAHRVHISNPFDITLSYEHYPEPMIKIIEEKKNSRLFNIKTIIKMNYQSPEASLGPNDDNDNYDELIKMLEKYQLYKMNKYGYYGRDNYWNDKDICRLFDNIRSIHKRDHHEYYNHYHGNMSEVKYVQTDSSSEDVSEDYHYDPRTLSEYQLHGVDLMNDVFCNVHFSADFGQYTVKPTKETVELNIKVSENANVSKSDKTERDKDVLHVISANGLEYETYNFLVSMYKKDNQIITRFTIEQMSTNSNSGKWSPDYVLKNKIEIEGDFFEVYDLIEDYVAGIYDAYNMPLDYRMT